MFVCNTCESGYDIFFQSSLTHLSSITTHAATTFKRSSCSLPHLVLGICEKHQFTRTTLMDPKYCQRCISLKPMRLCHVYHWAVQPNNMHRQWFALLRSSKTYYERYELAVLVLGSMEVLTSWTRNDNPLTQRCFFLMWLQANAQRSTKRV